MTKQEFENFLKSVTYKPGFKVKFWPDQHGSFVAQLDFRVQDALKPDKMTVGSVMLVHDPEFDEEILRIKLINAIRTFEEHEIDEWLKINGEYVSPPHPTI